MPHNQNFFQNSNIISPNKAKLVNGSGVNTEDFNYSQIPQQTVFMTMARLLESKGLREFAKAAKIVKNNVPNYDYVNDFVKDLRQLPFGNFVSFPAEIYRTGYNILNQAWKEIFTTHTLADGRVVTPFRSIGMKRMFGLASTVVGVPYGTVEAFKAIHDVTEEEMAALRRFVPEWSKNSTLVPIRGEDGKLKYIDFSHANAYDTIIRPINSMIVGVQRGMDEGELGKEVKIKINNITDKAIFGELTETKLQMKTL